MKTLLKVLILWALAVATMPLSADEVGTDCPKTKDSLTRSASEKSKSSEPKQETVEKPETVINK